MKKLFFVLLVAAGLVSEGAAEPSKASGAVAPVSPEAGGKAGAAKLPQKQWKAPGAFLEGEDSSDEAVKEYLMSVGVGFPEGASAHYSPKTRILTVTNTPEELTLVDRFVRSLISESKDVRMPLGSGTKDFRKWAAMEWKRRQAVFSAMKKVRNEKGAQKCLEVIKKQYAYDKSRSSDGLLPFLQCCSRYAGSMDDVAQEERERVKEKFSKQNRMMMQEQERMLDSDFSDSEACRAVIDYVAAISVESWRR